MLTLVIGDVAEPTVGEAVLIVFTTVVMMAVSAGCKSEVASELGTVTNGIKCTNCIARKINARTWVIACASFGVLKAADAYKIMRS